MKSSVRTKISLLWFYGLLLFVFRLVQNRYGFDPETGLALPGSWKTVAMIVLLAVMSPFTFPWRTGKERVAFEHHFGAPEKSLTALTVGCMMLVAGGALLAVDSLTAHTGIAPIITGALAVVTGLGFLLLGRKMRAGEVLTVAPTLPSLFFGVFLVLTIYMPCASDPVLLRYFLPILAAAMVAYAFGQLAGFLRKETRPCVFSCVAGVAVVLSIAAIADGGRANSMLFGGCAVVLSVFLALQGGSCAAAPTEELPEE